LHHAFFLVIRLVGGTTAVFGSVGYLSCSIKKLSKLHVNFPDMLCKCLLQLYHHVNHFSLKLSPLFLALEPQTFDDIPNPAGTPAIKALPQRGSLQVQ